jgi:hypothetical protein
MGDIMNYDDFNGKFISDRRRVKLEHIMDPNYIPLFSGRPNRDQIISNDDIANLKIAFETTSSVPEFVKQV